MNFKCAGFWLLMLLTAPAFEVYAQVPETSAKSGRDTTTSPSDTLSKFLDELIISAHRIAEPRRNVAQQISLLTAKDIRFLQPATTADLLMHSGTVAVQKSQQGGGSPVIRGFEASRILLVLDGVRMNNLIYRSGHLQNILSVDNLTLDRVEILSGPASSMYGSDALGGVIILNTHKPVFAADSAFLLQSNAMLRYCTVNNETTGHLDFNLGTKKIASYSAFTFSAFDDLRSGKSKNFFYKKSIGDRYYYAERRGDQDTLIRNTDPSLQVPSGYNQYDIIQKISFKKTDNLIHHFNFQISGTTDIPRYDRLTDPDSTGLNYAEWYYGPQKRLMGIYTLESNRTGKLYDKLMLIINYQHLEESRHTRRFNSNDLAHRYEKVNVAGMNLDMHKSFGSHSFQYGFEFQFNNLKSTASLENIFSDETRALDTRYPDGRNELYSGAFYLSHSWRINNQWRLTSGLRTGYSSLISEFKDTSFYPFPFTVVENKQPLFAINAGTIWQPGEDWKLSLLFSTGYRVPNVDDLSKVFESSPGNLIVPNPDIKPEKTYNSEIALTWSPGKKFSIENTLYYTIFNDAIITAPFRFNGSDSLIYDGQPSAVYANQNAREAFIWGFSSGLTYRPDDHVDINATAAYTYGRIVSNNSTSPLDHIPPFMARAQLKFHKNNLQADFITQYNSWKRIEDYYLNGEDNEQYATPEGMPAWIVFHFRFAYTLNKNIMLQAGCDNILDTQYRVFSSGINAPGRNFLFSVKYSY